MANRTSKGNVTEQARKASGMADHHGAFPVFDEKSALAALKLRNNGKGISAASVIAKVERWARAHKSAAVLAAVERAKKG